MSLGLLFVAHHQKWIVWQENNYSFGNAMDF
jgi:hypothetical protein